MKILTVIFGLLLVSCSFATLRENSNPFVHHGAGCVEYPSPEQFDKVWAISDVHGQLDSLKTLLIKSRLVDENGHWQARNELLVVIGDSIDKGPSSREVLDYWIQLTSEAQKFNSSLVHLLGNHEAEFLADPTNPKVNFPLPLTSEQSTFLRQMPMVLKVGTWIFVHAGKVPVQDTWTEFCSKADSVLSDEQQVISEIYKSDFFIGSDSPIEAKDWWKNNMIIQGQIRWLKGQQLSGIVFGHQTKAFQVPYKVARSPDKFFFKIDSGMGEGQTGEMLLFPKPEELNHNEALQALRLMSNGKMESIP
mgnify:CR=1 FL=1